MNRICSAPQARLSRIAPGRRKPKITGNTQAANRACGGTAAKLHRLHPLEPAAGVMMALKPALPPLQRREDQCHDQQAERQLRRGGPVETARTS